MSNGNLTGIKLAALLAALVLLISWVFLREKDNAVVNLPSAGNDIIAFGDSLVAGSGASSPGSNFVSLLSEKLGRPIANLGVPGDTTSSGLARISQLDNYRPQIVILLLGGNDRLRRISQAETVNNLSEIISQIQSRGGIVLLLGVKGNLWGNGFGAELESLAEKKGALFVPDVLDGLFGNPKFMADPIHPNDAGYRIIAEKVYPKVRSLLEKHP